MENRDLNDRSDEPIPINHPSPFFGDEAEWRGELVPHGGDDIVSLMSNDETVNVIMGPLFDIYYL